MVERKERFVLLGRFEKLHLEKMGYKTNINKYNEQWAADALLESFGKEDCCKAMDYYFQINDIPSWKSFARNADRLLQSIRMIQEDSEQRKEMRQKAREWLNG